MEGRGRVETLDPICSGIYPPSSPAAMCASGKLAGGGKGGTAGPTGRRRSRGLGGGGAPL